MFSIPTTACTCLQMHMSLLLLLLLPSAGAVGGRLQHVCRVLAGSSRHLLETHIYVPHLAHLLASVQVVGAGEEDQFSHCSPLGCLRGVRACQQASAAEPQAQLLQTAHLLAMYAVYIPFQVSTGGGHWLQLIVDGAAGGWPRQQLLRGCCWCLWLQGGLHGPRGCVVPIV
jgi:hypothetical protein